MKQFIAALKRVSSLFENVDTRGVQVTDWQLVLARAVVGLIVALAGGVIAFLVANDRIIAGILGTLAVVGVRFLICPKSESKGAWLLSRKIGTSGQEPNYSQMAFFVLTFLRPLCFFLLLMRGRWLWVAVAMTLAEAIVMEMETERSSVNLWSAACGASLVFGALMTVCGQAAGGNGFVITLIVCAIAWMLPMVLKQLNLRMEREATLFAGEVFFLLLGILGQAM